MNTKRRVGDYYSLSWEVVPALLLAALLVLTFQVVVPKLARAGDGDATSHLQALFLPIMAILFYIASSFGGWLAVRVEDPARDINWLLVRLDPSRVVADPEQKERYLGAVVRTLFLVKTAALLAFLVVQINWCYR